jgi:hypothetical protein
MRLLLVPLVLLALGAGSVQTPMPTPTAAASSPADFDAVADDLHQQAVGALERLRQARERRMAMAAPSAL